MTDRLGYLAMIPPGVAIILVLAGALAVLAAIVVGMYLLRNFISPDKRGIGGMEDPRRTWEWENFCCLYSAFVFIFFVILALAAAYVLTSNPPMRFNR